MCGPPLVGDFANGPLVEYGEHPGAHHIAEVLVLQAQLRAGLD